MGRTLIIAEKPAQAREYAKALGVRRKRDGYLENDQYVITWCYGHLLELERPEAYMDLDRVGRRWNLNRLPVLPGVHEFSRVVKPTARQQYHVVQQWLTSRDIEQVVCGTDADREGQLLFQEVWDSVRCQKPLARLWVSSLTTEAIRDGMHRLLAAETVAGLAAAGYGRSLADWDFGMNLTEGFTAIFGSFDPVRKKPNVISIGRVQTPTLALIVEREWEIERFVAKPYFEVHSEFVATQGNYVGKWWQPGGEPHRLLDRQVADAIVEKTQGKPGVIVKLEQKEVSEPPPLLFELTSLTVAASKRYGFTAQQVLQGAQSLYEKKAITYPRTDSPYLSADLVPKLPAHLKAVCHGPYLKLAEEAGRHAVPTGKRVVHTITAHHAIIPTTERVDISKLQDLEQKLYDLIVRRFLAIWLPPARYQQTEVLTEVAGEFFRTKGKVMLILGWKQAYSFLDHEERSMKASGDGGSNTGDNAGENTGENVALPSLKAGENVQADHVFVEEKLTKSPKRFTQGDLLKTMETAGKQIDDELLRQQLKGKGLGTVATRPAILENLMERGYIIQEQKVLKPTSKGSELIRLIQEQLPESRLLISAEMTGQMEFDLARVEKGELALEQFMMSVAAAIGRIIEELRSFEQNRGKYPLAQGPTGSAGKTRGRDKPVQRTTNPGLEVLGHCPICGGTVVEGKKGYGCANWSTGCRFVVWKNAICGKVLTPSQMKSLLKKGKTPLMKGFKSKNGTSFAAYLIWKDKDKGTLKFEFAKT